MQQAQAEQIIAVELLSKTILSCEKLLNKTAQKNQYDLYNLDAINASLKESFDFIIDSLQQVVDAYYHSYYEVSAFTPLTDADNIEWQADENLKTINAAKKLINFIA